MLSPDNLSTNSPLQQNEAINHHDDLIDVNIVSAMIARAPCGVTVRLQFAEITPHTPQETRGALEPKSLPA